MAPLKSMLKRTAIEVALRRRTCKHSHSTIKPGEKCLVVYDTQYEKRTYSAIIGLQMIRQAHLALDDLERIIKSDSAV